MLGQSLVLTIEVFVTKFDQAGSGARPAGLRPRIGNTLKPLSLPEAVIRKEGQTMLLLIAKPKFITFNGYGT